MKRVISRYRLQDTGVPVRPASHGNLFRLDFTPTHIHQLRSMKRASACVRCGWGPWPRLQCTSRNLQCGAESSSSPVGGQDASDM
jgi:hypothetical protein